MPSHQRGVPSEGFTRWANGCAQESPDLRDDGQQGFPHHQHQHLIYLDSISFKLLLNSGTTRLYEGDPVVAAA